MCVVVGAPWISVDLAGFGKHALKIRGDKKQGKWMMPVAGLNHVNIRTEDIGSCVKFYEEVLGLRYARGPEIMGRRGHWLHDERGDPIIHLRDKSPDGETTGAVDHIAINCTDYEAVVSALAQRNVDFSNSEGFFPGSRQVFVRDPNGVMLELNFDSP